MLDHLEIHTRRLTECVGFYQAVLEPLGYALIVDGDQKGFGHDGRLDFWLVDGEASTHVHYAFAAHDWKSVHAAFDRADSHGGRQDRGPALAPHIHPDYFAGYARDPDDRLVEFVCQRAGASTEQDVT
ncbi:MAG: hypothetical protein JWL96_200 [Sphingomonas bacterium]|uniref:VOC family protein n=1 Tax=Sphingomonas bacterium TaxID=1895847 RepID=UPI0026372873|nr:VOC family protein [Sphingomonas bacterium]MDB5708130.1 hypothetical protein [Sphingomonas bacterium]